MKADQSILDSVRHDVASLERGLGPRDRTRLNEYLEHVREVEQRIQRAEKQARETLVVPDAPVGVPASFEEHVGVMFELMAVAYEADLTRVFTFMMNREASQLVFPNLGVNEPWHHTSHHGNEPEKLAALVKINTWQIELFGRFLDRLAKTPDGDGSLLDHSLILYGSGMSDSNSHSALDVPLLLAGQGRRPDDRRPPPRRAEGDAARQRDARPGAEVRRGGRSVRRQHRTVRAVIADVMKRPLVGLQPCCCSGGGAGGGAGGRHGDAAHRRGQGGRPRRGAAPDRRKADVNASEPDGTTALHWAVRAGDRETVAAPAEAGRQGHRRQSVRRDADGAGGDQRQRRDRPAAARRRRRRRARANPEGETALMTAARAGSIETTTLLASRGADVNARESWFGETALMWAAAENHADMVRTLASLGAEINARSNVVEAPELEFPKSGGPNMPFAARRLDAR